MVVVEEHREPSQLEGENNNQVVSLVSKEHSEIDRYNKIEEEEDYMHQVQHLEEAQMELTRYRMDDFVTGLLELRHSIDFAQYYLLRASCTVLLSLLGGHIDSAIAIGKEVDLAATVDVDYPIVPVPEMEALETHIEQDRSPMDFEPGVVGQVAPELQLDSPKVFAASNYPIDSAGVDMSLGNDRNSWDQGLGLRKD